LYESDPVPPFAETDAEPVLAPQVVPVTDILEVIAAGCVSVAELTAVQPFPSVTVTEYVPAFNPVITEPVCPPGFQE
jgi:hypothetical protein